MPRQKRRYIVALKTQDVKEGIDSWLNQYERNLSVLRDGTILIAHFAKLNGPAIPQGLATRKDITIGDFEQMRVIGHGGFSRVILARKKDTGRLYAIKILRKDRIFNDNQIKPILSERTMLEQLDHPFLIKLHWAFQSTRELYFVMDICTGGELFVHLLQQRRFSEKIAKFYMTEILLGFKHLHDRDIVYRDIKPENILVDMDGHIRIADFGLAKIIGKRERSHSFCGSPEYLSPEMLKNEEGHDRRLDIYCLGVLLYEMLTGLPPFYDEDHIKMFDKVMHGNLVLDQPYLSKDVKDLLFKLLQRDQLKRPQSIEEIMQHTWFKDVDWQVVLSKTAKSPLVPDINSCYFENSEEDQDDSPQRQTTNFQRTNQRRQSYYVHSTVNLQSQFDDRNSVNRSSSQLKQFFESSILMTNLNESGMQRDYRLSFLEASSRSLLKRADSAKNSSVMFSSSQQRLHDGFTIASEQRQKAPTPVQGSVDTVVDCPFPRADQFADFDYAQPPLAEIQILRVLESHIKRKKKAQLDKARRFKDMMSKKQESGSIFKEDDIVPLSQSKDKYNMNRFIPVKNGVMTKYNNLNNNQSNRRQSGQIARPQCEQLAQVAEETPDQLTQIDSRSLRNFRSMQTSGHGCVVKDISEPSYQVFSDSEAYPSQVKKTARPFSRKKSSQTLTVAEEFEKRERIIADRVVHYDEKVVNPEVYSKPYRANANSKAHSLDQSRPEPEQLPDPPSRRDNSPRLAGVESRSKAEYDQRNYRGGRRVDSSSDGLTTSEGTIGNESLSLRGDQSVDHSVSQKPLISSHMVSKMKMRTQIKKVRSGDCEYPIHHFNSIQERRSGSKRNLGLGRGAPQSLQEKAGGATMKGVLSSGERKDDSSLCIPSLREREESRENFTCRNNYTGLRHDGSQASGSLRNDFSRAIKNQTESAARFSEGTDFASQSNDLVSHKPMTGRANATKEILVSSASMVSPTVEQKGVYQVGYTTNSSAEVAKQNSAFQASGQFAPGQMQAANDVQRFQMSAQSESEMTMENFCRGGSHLTLASRESKVSNQSAQWKSMRQLALEPVKEKQRRQTQQKHKNEANLASPFELCPPGHVTGQTSLAKYKPTQPALLTPQISSTRISMQLQKRVVPKTKQVGQTTQQPQKPNLQPGKKSEFLKRKESGVAISMRFTSPKNARKEKQAFQQPRTYLTSTRKSLAKARPYITASTGKVAGQFKTDARPLQSPDQPQSSSSKLIKGFNNKLANKNFTTVHTKEAQNNIISRSASSLSQDESDGYVADETESRPSKVYIDLASRAETKQSVRQSDPGIPSYQQVPKGNIDLSKTEPRKVQQEQPPVSLKMLLGSPCNNNLSSIKSQLSPDSVTQRYAAPQQQHTSVGGKTSPARKISISGPSLALKHQLKKSLGRSPLQPNSQQASSVQLYKNKVPSTSLSPRRSMHLRNDTSEIQLRINQQQKAIKGHKKSLNPSATESFDKLNKYKTVSMPDATPPTLARQTMKAAKQAHLSFGGLALQQQLLVAKQPKMRQAQYGRKQSAATINIDLGGGVNNHLSKGTSTTKSALTLAKNKNSVDYNNTQQLPHDGGTQLKRRQSAEKTLSQNMTSFVGGFRKKHQGGGSIAAYTPSSPSKDHLNKIPKLPQMTKQTSSRSLNIGGRSKVSRKTHQVSLSIAADGKFYLPYKADSSRNLMPQGGSQSKKSAASASGLCSRQDQHSQQQYSKATISSPKGIRQRNYNDPQTTNPQQPTQLKLQLVSMRSTAGSFTKDRLALQPRVSNQIAASNKVRLQVLPVPHNEPRSLSKISPRGAQQPSSHSQRQFGFFAADLSQNAVSRRQTVKTQVSPSNKIGMQQTLKQ